MNIFLTGAPNIFVKPTTVITDAAGPNIWVKNKTVPMYTRRYYVFKNGQIPGLFYVYFRLFNNQQFIEVYHL